MAIQLNPLLTTNAAGLFNTSAEGVVQGTAMDDPAVRYQLAGGILASTETLPMWGGVGIEEDINYAAVLGPNLKRAADFAHLTGFSVFNQATAFVSTPQSPVPTAQPGQTVPFYRFGSKARIIVAMDPALVSLNGGLITQQVSWDFTNQRLVAFATNALPVQILKLYVPAQGDNVMTVAYNSGTGFATWTKTGNAAAEILI